ncbi:hypothetical protein SAY87_023561 [Trapa incisa]|nr:hypothetical protein SAY87_023561 [Trapa incisa]
MEGPDTDNDREEELQEFTFACTGRPNSSPISADKIFLNGQIKPSHPFKVPGDQGVDADANIESRQKRSTGPGPAAMREPLMRLFSRERVWNSGWDLCSSHENEEIKGAPCRYCLWRVRRVGKKQKGNETSHKSSNKKMVMKEISGDEPVDGKRWKVKNLVFNHGTQKVSHEPVLEL